MTAPLTPRPQQPQHDPWQASGPAGAVPSHAHEHQEDGPGMRTELREAAVVTVTLAVCGLLLGALWMWLAPHVPLVADAQAVYLKDTEGEQAVGVDGTFTLLGVAFGVVSAVAVFLWRKRGGVPLVVALALGGLLGGLLAWRFGIWLGPTQDVAAHAKEVGKGVTFDAPLELNAKGALLAWPLAAMIVHLGLTGLFGPRDPDPYFDTHYPQDTPPAP
ncbi:AAA family ATPase [Streptomyces sp. NBC_01003]|uniref:AAA family ATPase n=1 Tax=unclassified Streptomyces TaxID=2593676 RepID=UPI0037D7BD46|nr:AAA family ATPase [Streptomyces sp. NBC_01003]